MFDRLRRHFQAAGDTAARRATTPPDVHALPEVRGVPFERIDRAVLSAYLGRTVVDVEAMGVLGPEATSALGRRAQAALREAAAGQPLEPGELVPGQNAARIERLRAQGVPEEQIQVIRERIAAAHAEHTRDGWTVVFDGDDRASVRVVAAESEDGREFDRLSSRWSQENGTDGYRPQETPLLSATVQRDARGPYECYTLSGRLVARGATRTALVSSVEVSHPTMVALAAIALRAAGD